MSSGIQKRPGRLFQDAFLVLLGLLIFGTTFGAMWSIPELAPPGLVWIARGLMGASVEMLTIAILREIVPKPKVGSHIIGRNRFYYFWLMSSAVSQLALHPLVRLPFWHLHLTRTLYLRALGARISGSARLSPAAVIRDPSLLQIDDHASVETAAIIESASIKAGRIHIGTVTIGQRCSIGHGTILMPDTSLGHDTRVEAHCIIGEDTRIGVSVNIAERACLQKGVKVGAYTRIGSGVILQEGATIHDRARIAAGAVVAAGASVAEREVWAGVPAQPQNGRD